MTGRVLRFLRYSTRHHLLLVDGRLRLNPISYSSHNKNRTRTRSWHEPMRLFVLRQRLFAFAGRQRCGRRDDPFSVSRSAAATPDTWDWGPDGCRTCSYCGSIHPDDLIKICRLVPDDDRYAIEGTDKKYKVYITQPGVRNASEGAIKFYMQHAPAEPTPEDQEAFSTATRISRERFAERWKMRSL